MNKAIIKEAVKEINSLGYPFTAKYVEKYGLDGLCPSFRKPSREAEEFYRKCVEEGHPWDWYFEFPDDTVF